MDFFIAVASVNWLLLFVGQVIIGFIPQSVNST